MLAGLTYSTIIWFLLELLPMFNVIPIEEPGDFSISIRSGPLEFLIESQKKKNFFFKLICGVYIL